MTPTPTPRVFTIPAGCSFVDALAEGLHHQAGDAPEKLADMTVLLPTRRAGRSLREAFLRISRGSPLLLPRLIPLGDMEDDELLIGGWEGDDGAGDDGLALPPAVSGLRRQLMLSRLITARPDNDTTPEQAMFLAAELARLLDQVHTERLDFAALESLVPDAFAAHWQVTLDFLKLITELWPGLLAAEGAVDGAERRNRLIEARTRQWLNAPPPGPVIAAGSTGSIPATADLLAAVASLPLGAVVLPGLDRQAPDAVWRNLGPTHPQFGMARLIRHIGVDRAEVAEWPHGGGETTPSSRAAFLNAALAPAHAGTDPATAPAARPDGPSPDIDAAFAGVTRIDCPGPAEEAAVIALMMRRNLELPGRTAALVTPDRGLARRVAAELRRWDVEIDDSAGLPLAQTPLGAFLRLCIQAVAGGLAPVRLLAVLKHPLCALGLEPAACRRLARALEVLALRGPRPAAGIDGLRAAVAAVEVPVRAEIESFLDRMQTAIDPLVRCLEAPTRPLSALVRAHMEVVEAMALTATSSGAEALWRGEAGEMAAALMNDLENAADTFPDIAGRDYPALFEAAMAGRVVRPRYGTHPRLFIWGLLEARLQRADVMILGSLNEGSWPPETPASPWMSRPMMEAFGLSPPERRIGLTAHDFLQALGAPRVVMTRAERVGGAPTVPCRWLRQLGNLTRRLGATGKLTTDEPWLQWAEAMDKPARPRPVAPPRPTPPPAARPTALSVTRVETLIRDPYAIYAGRILKLEPLDPLEADPGAATRGTVVHDALDEFIKAFPDALPDDAERHLLEIGRRHFDSHLTRPGVRALWWPRFRRIARWFVETERRRRQQGYRIAATEISGEMDIAGLRGPFRLSARADRIDHRADIGYAIIDYKTGTAPTAPQVQSGLSPQLPLEAAIAEAGAFPGLPAGEAASLVYMRLTGGRQPGEERNLRLDVRAAIDEAHAGVTKLVHKFEDPATPYLSQPRPQFLNRYGDYDHLARVKEWRGRRRP